MVCSEMRVVQLNTLPTGHGVKLTKAVERSTGNFGGETTKCNRCSFQLGKRNIFSSHTPLIVYM